MDQILARRPYARRGRNQVSEENRKSRFRFEDQFYLTEARKRAKKNAATSWRDNDKCGLTAYFDTTY